MCRSTPPFAQRAKQPNTVRQGMPESAGNAHHFGPLSVMKRTAPIIASAAIGAVCFKERFGAPRIPAAALLVVGIELMLHAGQARRDATAGTVRARCAGR